MKKIAIIEGGGTGTEVVGIFKKCLNTICPSQIEYLSFQERFNYQPHTFLSLQKEYANKNWGVLKKLINKEVFDLKNFYRLAQEDTLGIFRTAINAETLYYVRRDIKKIKVVLLPITINNTIKNIIFIRDQLQGYYTNEKISSANSQIRIKSSFSQDNFVVLSNFVKKYLIYNSIKEYNLFFLYKFHLFGLELQRIIEKTAQQAGLKDVQILQPDTAIHKLLGNLAGLKDNIVLITGNEIGDVLLETLIHYYKLANKETFFTLNLAFVDTNQPFEVLQTMHGSADDIAGRHQLNPIATIRAAAYALENWLQITPAVNRFEKVIAQAYKNKITAPDAGGTSKTDQVLGYILRNLSPGF